MKATTVLGRTEDKTTRHTPGPWDWTAFNHGLCTVTHDKGSGIENDCELIAQGYMGEANARLIAAAPDLLNALKGVQEAFAHLKPLELGEIVEDALDAVDAVIAKAEGK